MLAPQESPPPTLRAPAAPQPYSARPHHRSKLLSNIGPAPTADARGRPGRSAESASSASRSSRIFQRAKQPQLRKPPVTFDSVDRHAERACRFLERESPEEA